jgi:hypothetical protein
MPETGALDIVMQIRFNIQPSATSTLACGLNNGNVILIDVTQQLLLAPPGSPLSLEITTVIRDEKAAAPDKRIITAMKWVSRQGDIVGDIVILTLI